ncbi:hypothetical protein [Rhodospirillum rubrum]|uniref:hypothetical protein n=1 Tax=Rhodospirillum rubrum TaxID=1085 RepID=UPI000037A670|nr:hypothetical protein [Rhodospirillum rubrum]AEO49791.1 hypothetical protein F11_16655 [Rhodospirillum rubrum F11]QXG79989.1 hypothetical protein KUL73_16760 [Rhodospirillum rubrum]
MSESAPYGMNDAEASQGLEVDNFTITLKGRQLTVAQAVGLGLLKHDSQTGRFRMGEHYRPSTTLRL